MYTNGELCSRNHIQIFYIGSFQIWNFWAGISMNVKLMLQWIETPYTSRRFGFIWDVIKTGASLKTEHFPKMFNC